MPAQTEIIDMITDVAGLKNIGLLSPAVDYAINFVGGKPIRNYIGGASLQTMNLQIQGKSVDQLALMNELCGICDKLTRKNVRTFPKSEEWEIRGVFVGSPPALKAKDESGIWYYATIITVNYFYNPKQERND